MKEIMRHVFRFFTSLTVVISFLFITTPTHAQDGLQVLKRDYPQLMQQFGEELRNQNADYVFAIDVSGTMDRYRDILVPALKDFFGALPDGDHVSLIKFGGEAKIDIGGSGTLNADMRKGLAQYADHLYDKPTSKQERERFYNHTDLDNMVQALLKDLSRTGRNDLKFVFIITDFEDDPSAERRGAADWQARRQEADLQLQNKNVNIVALNLPGRATHIDRVLSVFASFNPERQDITTGEALANWFNMHKNDMLKDRFRQIIRGMLTDTRMSASAEVDRDGNLTLSNITWHPNQVFNNLVLDSIACSNGRQHFEVRCRHDNCALPVQLGDHPTTVERIGRIIQDNRSWLRPRFSSVDDTLRLRATCHVAYSQELEQLLATPHPTYTTTVALQGRVFNYPLTWRTFIICLLLILLYIIVMLVKSARNRRTYITGSFSVWKNDTELVPPYPVRRRKKLTIGQGGDISAPVEWKIEIAVRRASAATPIIHLFSNPHYVVRSLRGEGCKPNGTLRMGNRTSIKVKENGIPQYTVNWSKK